jgi:hypothetical protein
MMLWMTQMWVIMSKTMECFLRETSEQITNRILTHLTLQVYKELRIWLVRFVMNSGSGKTQIKETVTSGISQLGRRDIYWVDAESYLCREITSSKHSMAWNGYDIGKPAVRVRSVKMYIFQSFWIQKYTTRNDGILSLRHRVQTSPGTHHPAFYPMGNEGGKAAEAWSWPLTFN